MQAFIRPPGSTWLKEAKPGEFYVPVKYQRDANGFATSVLNGTGNAQNERKIPTSRYTQLAVYVPGIEPQNFSLSDSALLIPAGSDLVLEIHYTTNGKPGSDLARVGMTEAKHRQVSLPHPGGCREQIYDTCRRSELRDPRRGNVPCGRVL